MIVRFANMTYKHARRVLVIIGGFTVLLIGIAMIVLPGPGVVVIILGLAILGTELVWARRILKKLKATVGLKDKSDVNPNETTPSQDKPQ